MTVSQLVAQLPAEALVLADPDREITGAYAGDLLSWVMGNAPHGCVWLTIMTNRNIVAVAQLLDIACILVAEDCLPEPAVLELCEQQGINLLRAKEGVFELSCRVGALL